MEETKKKAEILETPVSNTEVCVGDDAEANLIERETNRFTLLTEKDPQGAYRRYGFSLFCSLPPEQMAREALRTRKRTDDPCDLYNKGVFEIEDGKVDKALKHFQKAQSILTSMPSEHLRHFIEQRPTLVPDLSCNLYFCYLEQGEKSEGKKEFKQMQKLAKSIFPREEDMPKMWKAFAEVEEEL